MFRLTQVGARVLLLLPSEVTQKMGTHVKQICGIVFLSLSPTMKGMKKRIIIGLVFSLGIALGLFLMANFCDELLGSWLAKSRTEAAFPSYSVVIRGGIITKAKPERLYLRATDLHIEVSFKKPGGLLGDPVFMEIDNLPRDFKTTYKGNMPQVQSRGEASLALVFPPTKRAFKTLISIDPPSSKETFTFWVAGDNRSRLDLLETLLKKAKGEKPLFIVLGGDLVAHGLSWQYKRLLEVLDGSPVPVFAVPGNHDLEFCGRRNFTRYLAPDHYCFTYGNSIFAVLDTNHKDKGQTQWLDRILSNPSYVHRFVFVHKPPFDPRPGKKHCMHRKAFVQKLLEVLSKHKVDILFCSHIHSYIQTSYKGTKIIITGGLGAHRKKPIRPFHYVRVIVGPKGIKTQMVPLKPSPTY